MDKIHYNFLDVQIPDFDPEFFDLWLNVVVDSYNKNLEELSFVFCSDEELLKINQVHLEHDYYTDVITFNYNDKDSLCGDIYVSYDRVVENADEFSNGDEFDELCRVMVHGLLHLIGFDDKSEADKVIMRDQEEICLNKR